MVPEEVRDDDATRPVTSFKTVWARVKDAAGVQGRWHDNRHTFITDLAESPEASDATIMDVAGRVSKQMLKHYSHTRMEAKRRATDSQVVKPKTETVAQNPIELMVLKWSLDFNMNPLCSVLMQVSNGVAVVLDELIVPDSNTLAVCEGFLSRTEKWNPGSRLNVQSYGDSTGDQRHASASRTDGQIVKQFFGRYSDRFNVTFHVPSSNPMVKDRVNCVNARLPNHAGQHRLMVHDHCKQLIRDFEQVCWKTDPHGNSLVELDKSDRTRSHVSDAVGYLIAKEFPMRPQIGERSGPALL